jgi:hypothetical protein
MTTIETDARGLLAACPQCGQRNRLLYEPWQQDQSSASAGKLAHKNHAKGEATNPLRARKLATLPANRKS